MGAFRCWDLPEAPVDHNPFWVCGGAITVGDPGTH